MQKTCYNLRTKQLIKYYLLQVVVKLNLCNNLWRHLKLLLFDFFYVVKIVVCRAGWMENISVGKFFDSLNLCLHLNYNFFRKSIKISLNFNALMRQLRKITFSI